MLGCQSGGAVLVGGRDGTARLTGSERATVLVHKIVGNAFQQVVCQLEQGQTVYGELSAQTGMTGLFGGEGTNLVTVEGDGIDLLQSVTIEALAHARSATWRYPGRSAKAVSAVSLKDASKWGQLSMLAPQQLARKYREEPKMGLMDKVKQGAGQAIAKAQQGVNQGKAKLDEVQERRQWEALLRNLGAAVYAQDRQGGPASAVATALAALDEHVAVHGAGSTAPIEGDVVEAGGASYTRPAGQPGTISPDHDSER